MLVTRQIWTGLRTLLNTPIIDSSTTIENDLKTLRWGSEFKFKASLVCSSVCVVFVFLNRLKGRYSVLKRTRSKINIIIDCSKKISQNGIPTTIYLSVLLDVTLSKSHIISGVEKVNLITLLRRLKSEELYKQKIYIFYGGVFLNLTPRSRNVYFWPWILKAYNNLHAPASIINIRNIYKHSKKDLNLRNNLKILFWSHIKTIIRWAVENKNPWSLRFLRSRPSQAS